MDDRHELLYIDLAVAAARYAFADPAGRASWDAARGRRWSGSRQQRRSLRP
jgi:hypothetical protein